jgi:GNAT superfamily N-acetyltransferase
VAARTEELARQERGPSGAGPRPNAGPSRAGPEQVLLSDGLPLEVRPLTPDDEAGLRRFYAQLSPSTLFRRFMTPIPRLPEGSLAYLSATGGADREVIVATFGGRIVAEGRYHRDAEAGDAEIALVVGDEWQGRGIGPALAERLARAAARDGIVGFTGSMLADNRAARRLLDRLAQGAERWVSAGELGFRAPLRAGVGQDGAVSVAGVASLFPRRIRRPSRTNTPSRGVGGSGGRSLVRSDSTTA